MAEAVPNDRHRHSDSGSVDTHTEIAKLDNINASKQTSSLLINVEELLTLQGVEKQRLEFKKSWNTDHTQFQVIKTISAFANDFYNVNGGYIVIGVEEDESEDATSQIKFPLVGLQSRDLDKIQKQIMGACKGHIRPEYSPIISPEIVDGQHVLVIWAQASDNRPHKARDSKNGDFNYFIRKGTETTKATHEETKTMLTSSAKVPFDDRMAKHESGKHIATSAINKKLVKKFLDDIQSNLERDLRRTTLIKLKLVVTNGDEIHNGRMVPRLVPKNAALLMFNEKPEFYFHGAQIEVTQFSRDKEVQQEWCFQGPLDKQINECIKLVLSTTNKEKSVRTMTYPVQALREAIVNAVYHRGYEPEYNSPTKIYIRTHCLEICSYPGPHQSLKLEYFTSGQDIPPTPARNRRIGEFLKDLKLAEARGTGVNTIFRKMKENNNPTPQFDFDNSYFRVVLPAHPKFETFMLLKEVGELEAKGETSQASKMLEEVFDKDPSKICQSLLEKLILLRGGDWADDPVVLKYHDEITATTQKRCSLLKDLDNWLATKNVLVSIKKGVYLIEQLVKLPDADAQGLTKVTELVCRLFKKRDPDTRKADLQSNQNAHYLLEAYGRDIISSNSTIAYYFAGVKFNIYMVNRKKFYATGGRKRYMPNFLLTYLTRAREYLEPHLIVLSERGGERPDVIALQCIQLGYILYYLSLERKERPSACIKWYEKARELKPKIHINTMNIPPNYRGKFTDTMPHK